MKLFFFFNDTIHNLAEYITWEFKGKISPIVMQIISQCLIFFMQSLIFLFFDFEEKHDLNIFLTRFVRFTL